MGCERNHRNAFHFWMLFQATHYLPAVHFGKTEIHQYQIRGGSISHLKTLFAVDGEFHLVSRALQAAGEHIPVQLVIFYQQYSSHNSNHSHAMATGLPPRSLRPPSRSPSWAS